MVTKAKKQTLAASKAQAKGKKKTIPKVIAASSKKKVVAKTNAKSATKKSAKTISKTSTKTKTTTKVAPKAASKKKVKQSIPSRGRKTMSNENKSSNDKEVLESLATDNSLETVRDILFGAQVKQANERDQQLEKLINTRADTLQKTLDRQIKAVETSIAKLQDKLAKEAEQTATKVDQHFKQVEESIKQLDAQTQSKASDMFDDLTAEREALEKNAMNWNEDLAKELENIHNQLLDTKTDRLTLANLFTDMASSLIADGEGAAKK